MMKRVEGKANTVHPISFWSPFMHFSKPNIVTRIQIRNPMNGSKDPNLDPDPSQNVTYPDPDPDPFQTFPDPPGNVTNPQH
jgi:hypothetical protein